MKQDAYLKRQIDAATGRTKADLVLKNGFIVNVFTQEIVKGDVAVCNDKIVGVYECYDGETEIDITGKYVVPGLIDGHVHIESSQLSPEGFASVVVPRGTTTIIADPHEITNVCGEAGADYIARAAKNVPLDVMLMLPSCVPATPFDSSGAVVTGEDTQRLIKENRFWGLGEMMNYYGVVHCDGEVLKKLQAADEALKPVDGHAPGLSGKDLNGYVTAGIVTDHECTEIDEINEKISKGLYCHLRHGSATRNLVANAAAVNEKNLRRFLLCTDDRHVADLMQNGHLDDALRQLVKAGIDPVWAVIMATLNNAECYGLKGKGAIAPGYKADIVVFDNLCDFNACLVFKDGKRVAENGKPLFNGAAEYLPDSVLNTVHTKKLSGSDFVLTLRGRKALCMEMEPDNIVTKGVVMEVQSRDGDVVLQGTDLLKVAVVERHHNTGNIGKGLIKGYGLKGGALGITISHDSHNMILLGDDNEAMAQAANCLAEIGGGMVICHDGVCSSVALEIAGLMSAKTAEELEKASAALIEQAYEMGVDRRYEAFMNLAFLSLAVVPDLKITDKGLFDVNRFCFTDINAD